jgi:hypothetical protein
VLRLGTTFGDDEEETSVDVTNIGRRPVSIVEVAYEDHEKQDHGDGESGALRERTTAFASGMRS